MRQFQQGDVLIVEAKVPKGAKPVQAQGGRFILAEGEVTGHAHAIEECPDVELFEHEGTLYLRTKDDTTVKHEEHGPVTVPKGDYEIGIVQEYDYDTEERRNVAD